MEPASTMAGASLRRFRIEGVRDTGRVIGEGAYAVVKELEFRGVICAGKKLHSVLYENASREWRADMLQRFAAECELLGQLHHPHIVQFLGVRVEANSELPELVMEYLPTTLRRCLDTHGALPTEISCGVMLEVALGLRYLHEFSPPIIHRDLSSNNILLTTSMTAKISDLGVAKILDLSPTHSARMTQTQVAGTPTFMPPEAMLARPKYTTKVDIFSFGVLIVHILSGEWPMPSEAFTEDLHDPNRVVSVTEFERRREFINRISEGHPLLDLIEQCLSNVASHRPDAAKVVLQLEAERAQVHPRPVSQLELLQKNWSLRTELQQISSSENEAQREIDTLRKENEHQRKEIEAVRLEKDAELVTVRENLAEEVQAVRRTCDMLLAEKRREMSLLESEQRSIEAQRASLQREMEVLRSEMALREERSRAETESLSAQVQRLMMQPRAAPSEASIVQSPPGLSPHSRLQWRRGADAPEKISAAQAVVMGESVYVGGGSTGHKIIMYCWKKGAWSTLPECPVRSFGLIQFMDRLTTVGGVDRAGSRTGHVYHFVSETRRWQESIPPMPTARCRVTVVVCPSSSLQFPAIVACGGWGENGAMNTVEVFSDSTSQWHVAEPLPTPLYESASTTVGDTTYLLGGKDNSISYTKHCFSVCLDSLINKAVSFGVSPSKHGSLWTTVSDIPLTGSCAGSLKGTLLAIGGKYISTRSSTAVHLLASSGSWQRVRGGDLPEPCNCPTAVAVCLPSGELLVVAARALLLASIAK